MSFLDDTPIEIDEDEGSEPGKTIEEQMAELEQEVMGLQDQKAVADAAAETDEDVDMDVESTEDGEIEDIPDTPIVTASSTPILSVPLLGPSPSTLPVKLHSRGVKRANAEDLMDGDGRPATVPARLPPNKRRSLFGGGPVRPHRLTILLDHSDDESDNDDDDGDKVNGMSKLKINSGNVTPASTETAKLLAEKEENIRKLREQIEKRMKARILKKAAAAAATPPVKEDFVEVEVKQEPIDITEVKDEPVEEREEPVDVQMTESSKFSTPRYD